jgi:hypothetical protein
MVSPLNSCHLALTIFVLSKSEKSFEYTATLSRSSSWQEKIKLEKRIYPRGINRHLKLL